MAARAAPLSDKGSSCRGDEMTVGQLRAAVANFVMSNIVNGIVAIVDDDAAVRSAVSRLLNACDIRNQSYASPRDFLDSLEFEIPDCLIVDFHMPGMTGLELQEQLSRSGVSIPTIVITAHGDAALRDRCLDAGVAAYLAKPFDCDALLASINSAVATN